MNSARSTSCWNGVEKNQSRVAGRSIHHRPGCITISIAYCVDTYLLVPHAVLTSGWHASFVLAPIVFPLILSVGNLMAGSSEVPLSIEFSGFFAIVWLSLIIGSFGLIRSCERREFAKWPVVLLVCTYAASGLWIFLA